MLVQVSRRGMLRLWGSELDVAFGSLCSCCFVFWGKINPGWGMAGPWCSWGGGRKGPIRGASFPHWNHPWTREDCLAFFFFSLGRLWESSEPSLFWVILKWLQWYLPVSWEHWYISKEDGNLGVAKTQAFNSSQGFNDNGLQNSLSQN